MLEYTGVAALVAALSPLLVQTLVKSSWSVRTKSTIATAVAAVIALVYTVLAGNFNFIPDFSPEDPMVWIEAFATSLMAAFGTQQLAFQFLFKGTELQNSLANVAVKDRPTDVDLYHN